MELNSSATVQQQLATQNEVPPSNDIATDETPNIDIADNDSGRYVRLVYILDCLGASYQYDEQQPFCSAHRGKKRILVHIYITSNDLYVLNELYQLSICKYVSILFLGIGKRATRKNQIISSTV